MGYQGCTRTKLKTLFGHTCMQQMLICVFVHIFAFVVVNHPSLCCRIEQSQDSVHIQGNMKPVNKMQCNTDAVWQKANYPIQLQYNQDAVSVNPIWCNTIMMVPDKYNTVLMQLTPRLHNPINRDRESYWWRTHYPVDKLVAPIVAKS